MKKLLFAGDFTRSESDEQSTSKKRLVKEIKVCANFTYGGHSGDVAVLKLKKSIPLKATKNRVSLQLCSKELTVNMSKVEDRKKYKVEAVGLGYVNGTGKEAATQLQVPLLSLSPVIDDASFLSKFRKWTLQLKTAPQLLI